LRIAIIGVAHVHAPGYITQLLGKRSEGVELLGVFDEESERGKWASERYNLHLFRDEGEVIKANPDMIVLTTETSRHLHYVELAAENGIDVFCEKPLGTNLAQAREIASVVEKKGTRLSTGFNSRFNQENLKAREIIGSGEIGQVKQIRVRIAHSAALDTWFKGFSSWFTDRERAGGGALLDLGIHGADLLRFLLGDEAIEVTGFIANLSGAYSVEDYGAAFISFSRGTVALLEAGWAQVVEGIPWSPLEVYGDRGSVIRTELGLSFYSRTRREWVRPNLERTSGNALDDMIRAISEGREPAVKPEDAVKAQEIIEAAYRTSRKGSVNLPLQ
jgi:predicted dehydrogenase